MTGGIRIITPISGGVAAIVRAPNPPDPTAQIDARAAARDDSAASIIRELFAISMSLASCANTTDQHAASHIGAAIDALDHVISDVRTAIFYESPAPEPAPVTTRDDLTGGPS